MRGELVLILTLVSGLLLAGCASGDDIYYTCYGGVKVKDIAQCDFTDMNTQMDDCELKEIYDSGIIITIPEDTIPAFDFYKADTQKPYKFVSAKFHKLTKDGEWYRMNIFDTHKIERLQFFINKLGVIYEPVNCVNNKTSTI